MISLLEIAQNINEAGEMKLKPKGGGKTVVFKNKDNYEKALKSGDYEEPEDSGKPEEPKGKALGGSDFDRDFGDDEKDPYDTERGAYDAEKKAKGKYDKYGDPIDDEPEAEPSGEPEGKLTSKGKKIQKSKEEFDDIVDDANEPDDIGMWIDDNRYSLSADGNPSKTMRDYEKLEDAFTDAQEEDDWDAYEEQLEDLKNSISKRLDTMVDLHREKPESDEPKGDKPKEKPQQTAADSREARNRVIKRIGRQAFDKLSYGEMQAEYEDELEAMGKKESITINGQKYREVKESKKPNKHILKENYDRFFGDKK